MGVRDGELEDGAEEGGGGWLSDRLDHTCLNGISPWGNLKAWTQLAAQSNYKKGKRLVTSHKVIDGPLIVGPIMVCRSISPL